MTWLPEGNVALLNCGIYRFQWSKRGQPVKVSSPVGPFNRISKENKDLPCSKPLFPPGFLTLQNDCAACLTVLLDCLCCLTHCLHDSLCCLNHFVAWLTVLLDALYCLTHCVAWLTGVDWLCCLTRRVSWLTAFLGALCFRSYFFVLLKVLLDSGCL